LRTPNDIGRVAGRLSGVKKIIISERNIDLAHSWIQLRKERYLQRFANRVIVNAEAIRKLIEHHVPAWGKRIRVIPNGVDLKEFSGNRDKNRAKFRKKLDCCDGERLIGTVGSIKVQKNPGLLIEAYSGLREISATRLVFVGKQLDQELFLNLLRVVKEKGLQKRVSFLPETTDVSGALAGMDLFVLPSSWEGCPNALLEAMASGLPVLASDTSDNPQIIGGEEIGLVFRNGDMKDLQSKLGVLLKLTDEELEKKGRAARKRVEEYYSVSEMVERTEQVYTEVLAETRIR